MKDKKIILGMPRDYSLSKLIIKNLESLGLQVVYINPEDTESFEYESFKKRLLNLFHKIISGNKSYKIKLRREFYFKKKYEAINTFDEYDYCLFIRADFFEDDLIKFCKAKSKQILSYHYDGVNRNKEIYDKIPYFDTFFVFDKEDLKINPSFQYITNFYFDYPEENINYKIENDFYFLGSHHNSRKDIIFKLYEKLSQISNSIKFEIAFDKANYNEMADYKKQQNIKCLPKIINYELYLENVKKSNVIIDLVIDEHKGLSFRVFESLKYKKKLITTNKTIKDYPFYNENNVLILDDNSIEKISSFLEKPLVEIDQLILKTYSFSNWFKNLFNIKPFAKII